MSKRLRREEQQALELKELALFEDEQEDELQARLARIFAPAIWGRFGAGFKIQDLREDYYDQTLEIFKDHYITEEVLCRNSEMKDDETSTNSFLQRILYHLKDNSSIICLQEIEIEEDETDEIKKKYRPKLHRTERHIAGILVLKVLPKAEFGRVFSRVQLLEGEAMKKCAELTGYLNRKFDVYSSFECDIFLRYYALCVVPQYRRKGVGLQLFRAGLEVARAMRIPVVMGVFSNHRVQEIATRVGMQVMLEVSYVEWRDNRKELIFDDPGAGNYTCALMAGAVPPPPVPEPKVTVVVESEKGKGKLSRAEKRGAAEKKQRKQEKNK